MIEALSKFGLGGGIGFLVGLAAVWWIKPTTAGGTALLIAICIVISIVLGATISKLFGKRETKSEPR